MPSDHSVKFAKAKLVSLGPDRTEVIVHFNPASLVYTVENSTNQQSGDPKRKQFAAQFSGKLTMDLQFDTTNTGEDVRLTTNKVAKFMQSSANAGKNESSGNAQAQPVLSFQWGAYEFKGTMESFKETIDFFSADGVPLRSLVSIGLARQDKVFDEGADFKSAKVNDSLNKSLVPTSERDDVTKLATKAGDPSAARRLGADNGLDSLRSTGGAMLQVNGGIQLNAAAAFSASASISGRAGLSIGAGGGISAGASLGANAGVAGSASLQASAGAGGGALFGGRASVGMPATAGAFAGLETGRATISTTSRLDPLRMLRATTSSDVSTHANASFGLGGAASMGAGFSSDVGAKFNFSDRLVFDSG